MSLTAYQDSQDLSILSASPLQLVQMLYSGAIAAVKAAQAHLRHGEIRERSAQINKACAILEELMLSLDKESGGQIATNLNELYIYMHRRLITANIEQELAPLQEVEKLLRTLLEAWQQIPDSLPSPASDESCEFDASPQALPSLLLSA